MTTSTLAPSFGEIVLGDSITKELRVSAPIGRKKSRKRAASVVKLPKKGKGMIIKSGHSPLAIYVDVVDYKIKNILVYFPIGNGEELTL